MLFKAKLWEISGDTHQLQIKLHHFKLERFNPLQTFFFGTKMCPQEMPFLIRNQYSAIARKRLNTTEIIVRVKI